MDQPAHTTLYTISAPILDAQRYREACGIVALSYPFHRPFTQVRIVGSSTTEGHIQLYLERWSRHETDMFTTWVEQGIIGPYTVTPPIPK